jgi:hypothetical protein
MGGKTLRRLTHWHLPQVPFHKSLKKSFQKEKSDYLKIYPSAAQLPSQKTRGFLTPSHGGFGLFKD